ncbi:MAG: HD domain-containing protein [Sporichthyaceae bacterium]
MPVPAGIDYDWAVRTGGNLSPGQRAALLKPLLGVVARYPGQRLALAVGRRGKGGVDLSTLKIPDSRLAKDAEAEAQEVLSPSVREHSYRTFLFAMSLAELQGVEVDVEVAYVASLLHDLQLEHPTPGRCFALVGAERAERFALERDVAPERARRIAAEICGHITIGAADDIGSPGGFVLAGAAVDVMGDRLNRLDPAWVEAVLVRHPRLKFKRVFWDAWTAEGRAVPKGRSRWLVRYAGLPILARLAPFDE